MKPRIFLLLLATLALVLPLRAAERGMFEKDNLVAWCIVPFDAKHRGPEERAEMLEKLGIKKFAYDYRAEHIPSWDAELDALKRHGIELTAWWFPGSLNDEAKKTLELFKRHGVKPQLWVSGGGEATKNADEQHQRVEKEVARIRPIAEAAAAQGLKVALYNHGGWFGEPENQIEIIAKLGLPNVGLVYNLHHGHGHMDRFPALLQKMKPHLLALNLNGMSRGGDEHGEKILPLAQGDLDLQLLKMIRDSGWHGLIGILNHTGEDAEARLLDNLDGLQWLAPQLDGKAAGEKPVPRSWKRPAATPPSTSRGEASLSPAFGKALTGGMLTDGKAAYHEFPITIECRAKLDSAHAFNILVASGTKQSAEHWELYTFAGSGALSVFQPGRGGNVSADVNICDGKWHVLAAVLEATRVRLYVDGTLVKVAPCKPLTGQAVPGGLALGRLVEGKLGCDGAIDDVRISKGAREISAPSASPLERDAQTISIWNFDDLSAASGTPRANTSPAQSTPQNVPDEWIIPAAKTEELTHANGWPKMDDFKRWDRSLGGPTSNRFSALAQITKQNVKDLKIAWEYHSQDGTANIQCNPIIVDGVMFAPTAGWNIVAIDAANGKELWRFTPPHGGKRLEDQPARRGLLHWPGDALNPARVIFGAGNWLYALEPKTG
ncbi:MAG: LamG-like jellyroll fold domain-containing protein, partial [Chthoniobacteraceae bacterium]